jgi:hypothetical protein
MTACIYCGQELTPGEAMMHGNIADCVAALRLEIARRYTVEEIRAILPGMDPGEAYPSLDQLRAMLDENRKAKA